jgi:hypothetical protein
MNNRCAHGLRPEDFLAPGPLCVFFGISSPKRMQAVQNGACARTGLAFGGDRVLGSPRKTGLAGDTDRTEAAFVPRTHLEAISRVSRFLKPLVSSATRFVQFWESTPDGRLQVC